MGRPGAYLEVGRKPHSERPAQETLLDFGEFALPLSEEEQRVQASRCMMCGVAFCQAGFAFGSQHASGCPLHNLIPEWNDLLYRGLWHSAYARLSLTNPLSEFTGRVCPALCECACNLGLYEEPTTIKDNERAISDRAWADGDIKALAPVALGAPEVAVIGSGPAGLTAAWELTRRGAKVSIFEKNDRAGGLLMYGIPNMKLPKEIVRRRIELMCESGITFELGADVCDPAILGRLCDFAAIVVAIGAGQPRHLAVPGERLEGVKFAVDYLSAATKAVLEDSEPAINARGLDVVVIGGGDTGTDCVATALRQHAKSVRQFEFLPEPSASRTPTNPWPEYPMVKKTDYGQREASYVQGKDPRSWATDTIELTDDGAGALKGIKTIDLSWSSGKPERISATKRELPAQLVLIAIGFTGPRAEVLDALGVQTQNVRGGVRPVIAPGKDYRVNISKTSIMGVPRGAADTETSASIYIAGDAKNGSTLVVSAIADALACAKEVADDLGL